LKPASVNLQKPIDNAREHPNIASIDVQAVRIG